jgi:hypothetical protein
MLPEWANNVKPGDWLTVKDEFMRRGGEQGQVVAGPFDDGVSLDFFCDSDGDPSGVPSIEFWEWDELVPLVN